MFDKKRRTVVTIIFLIFLYARAWVGVCVCETASISKTHTPEHTYPTYDDKLWMCELVVPARLSEERFVPFVFLEELEKLLHEERISNLESTE